VELRITIRTNSPLEGLSLPKLDEDGGLPAELFDVADEPPAGEILEDGQFATVWQTDGLVPGDAWSDHLPGSKVLISDWPGKNCGNFNTKTGKCGSGD